MIGPVQLDLFARNLERLGVQPPAGFTRTRALLRLGAETAHANPADALLADFATGTLSEEEFPDRLRAAALEAAAKVPRTRSCATSPRRSPGTPPEPSATTATESSPNSAAPSTRQRKA